MLAQEVAVQLNLELQEFRKIEESIAAVLKLKKDPDGNFVYRQDHIESLREVFTDLNAEEFIPLAQPVDSQKEKLETKSVRDQYYDNGTAKAIPLNTKEKSSPEGAKIPQEGEREVRSAIPFFERIKKSDELSVEKEAAPKGLEIASLVKMIQDQRTYFERKMQDLEQGELKALREENLRLKKEVLALEKEKKTFRNIIRNQNEDKRYLIEKLNEKFSLKNILQWKTFQSKAFEGVEQI